MISFNVIVYDFNKREFIPYDIIPDLLKFYYENKKDVNMFEDFKALIETYSKYNWSYKCEYEIILSDWPCQKVSEKWDIHKQVMMNLDAIAKTLVDAVIENKITEYYEKRS